MQTLIPRQEPMIDKPCRMICEYDERQANPPRN